MYEDWTQNHDPEIDKEYVIYDTPIPCHIIYNHVQIIAQL